MCCPNGCFLSHRHRHRHRHKHRALHIGIRIRISIRICIRIHNLIHLLNKQIPSRNWMNDGFVCSNHSSSVEAEHAATLPAPTTYAEAAAASPIQPPALAIASPTPNHSKADMPPAPSCQAQTIIIDNIITKHTRAGIEIKQRR